VNHFAENKGFQFSSSVYGEESERNQTELLENEVQISYDLRDLNLLISTTQRDKIVELIFKNDEEKYQKMINLFNRIKSWEDASELLDLIYISNKLDPHSVETIEFTSLIYSCFY
jgi:hypothetical protein